MTSSVASKRLPLLLSNPLVSKADTCVLDTPRLHKDIIISFPCMDLSSHILDRTGKSTSGHSWRHEAYVKQPRSNPWRQKCFCGVHRLSLHRADLQTRVSRIHNISFTLSPYCSLSITRHQNLKREAERCASMEKQGECCANETRLQSQSPLFLAPNPPLLQGVCVCVCIAWM